MKARSHRYFASKSIKQDRSSCARLFLGFGLIPEPEEFDNADLDETPIAFECLGCGMDNDHGGECEYCCGHSLEPVYF